ncbi:MAG: VanZ family protein [Oscillospiraceae bacterium]|nr:VanZ family protein [Oscillospiraceae bacterium]
MKKPWLLRVLACIWLAVLLRITVFRPGCFSHGLFSGRVEWRAFAYYWTLVRRANWGYFSYLFVGNLVWFAPAGFLVGLGGGKLRQAALAGFGLSLLVETLQFVLGSGVTELDDLILNTAGALLGFAAASLYMFLRSKKHFSLLTKNHII